jgi:hypothetical protein
MKSTIFLTTALFLASAPSPDSKAISEFSAGFLSVGNDHGLMALETSLDKQFNAGTASLQTVLSVSEAKDPEEKATQEQLQIN